MTVAGTDTLERRPIKGEMFGATRLGSHARKLARRHALAPTGRPGWFSRRNRGPLIAQLDATERALDAARETLAVASAGGEDVGPAGAWLLDNFFVVIEQLPEIRAILPAGYYRELPKLVGDGPRAGYPRIYDIVLEFITHTDGRLDEASLSLMLAEYQRVRPLTLGELWAIPAMLRMGYLENVRRMALRAARDVADRASADAWVSRLIAAKPSDGHDLSGFVHRGPNLTPAFLTRFLQQIRSLRSDFTPLLWLEQWIAEDVMTVEDSAQRSVQELALTQLVMANSIASLRLVANIDWTTLVEAASTVEATLREDPAHAYARMTRATRDRYRHSVERIAKGSTLDEGAVAVGAVRAARTAAAEHGSDDRRKHVGHYLIGEGRRAFEHACGLRADRSTRVRETILAHPAPAYFGAVAIVFMATLAALLAPLRLVTAGDHAVLLGLAIALAALPAADVAIALVHQIVNLAIPATRLPRLDYADDVPAENRTVVVVPLLLGSPEAVTRALDHIEVQFLANRDREIRFALLSDFLDSTTEHTGEDAAIIDAAVAGIRVLNDAYREQSDAPFYLLHRARRWNAADEIWMGWERKRGKLVEFNAYIRGAADRAFAIAEGDLPWLRSVRYVITLDADTVLPRSAAAALIGTIAHPLNRALYDPARGRVVRGYGILQPRVSVSLPSASESRFAAVYAGHPGVDPYTTAVSDVYQDLFGEGTFTGKGIYDVDIVRQATDGRFPENSLLSHDLLEGTFARAGLVTDVEVFDDYPTRYLTSSRRAHRWIRGDWQLVRWLTTRVPGRTGANRDPLSALSRWKIADNLRRSTTPIALLLWLAAGMTVLPGSWAAWTAAVLAAFAAPWIAPLVFAAARPPRDQAWRPYYAAVARDGSRALQQFALAVVLLPDQALLALDAIARTVIRVRWTRRRLLEWQTASHAEQTTGHDRWSIWRRMWPSVLLGAGIMAAAAWRANLDPAARGLAWWVSAVAWTALTMAWMLVPETALALSAPVRRRSLMLDAGERAAVLRYALHHWRFFDRFVTAETHWLAADNFQETPEPLIASRTSPTNIGLQLLATASAGDLGFLTRGETIVRLEHAFDALDRMPRVHGHFFNWYSLADLTVLDPPYISTVDSGNLAGHLVAVAQACVEMALAPVDDGRVWAAVEAEAGRREGTDGAWVGERLLAYHSAVLELRRRATTGDADIAAAMLWVRQRLQATADELSSLDLDAECDASASLREVAATSPAAAALVARLDALAVRARDMATAMDFHLVYDERRRLFSIGYDARSGTRDESLYDLLASESRLASFIAISKDDVPVEHWFHLGRSLTVAGGATALASWSGTMFEYLMPLLVMPARPFSLLDQTCHAAVQRHVAYAETRGVPWGISESAYNLRDRHDTYQYRAFGVPDLALKRGLASDLVVAPYATALALAVDAHEALKNLVVLEERGALGPYGFYDALDYTRHGEDQRAAVVRTNMAHHVGMTLVAFDNALSIGAAQSEGIWQRRFMADAAVRATALLLDERIPRRYVPRPAQSDAPVMLPAVASATRIAVHEVSTPHTPEPHVALLGGNSYSVLLTNAGGGYSRANGIDVLRWRADTAREDTGHWIYVKDLTAGTRWSAAYQPTCATPASYRATFAADRVVFARRDGAVDTHTEIVVVASEQAELRRVTLVNRSRVTRELELTSYGEVVLCPADADRAHPAFQKLFVETERVQDGALLASRRPRSADEAWPWCVHVVASGPERVGDVSCETDRARFIGRGRSVRAPVALDRDATLSGTVGAVLDPIVALRVRVRIEPGRSAMVTFTTAVAPTRDAALQLADRYRDSAAGDRALSLARTEAEVELRDLDIAPADLALYQELAGALIYPHEALRASAAEREAVTLGQSALWAQGISGDWPIVLATIRTPAGLASVRQLLVAHRYWRMKGIRSDLVILNTKTHSYAQDLHDQLMTVAISSGEGGVLERPGGVFVRRADQLSPGDSALVRAVARIHVTCDGVGLGDIVAANLLSHASRAPAEPPDVAAGADDVASAPSVDVSAAAPPANGYGELTGCGDYTIDVAGERVPPAPWANVIANPAMGFCITERGGGFAWAENSHFYRLTPWSNDPVSDPCGEVLYLRDTDSGATWTPTPGPSLATGRESRSPRYLVTHAPGMTRFSHTRGNIVTELTLGVPRVDAVKIAHLRIVNRGAAPRHLSLTSYVELVLGAERERTRHQLHTRYDASSGALFAQNFFTPDFTNRVAFSWISETVSSYTARRDHFLGRNGNLVAPAGLAAAQLSRASGAGYDPCAALQCVITLQPNETHDVVVLLGAADSDAAARQLIDRYGSPDSAASAIRDAVDAWNVRLSVISARTPDAEFDVLLNRWSLYQALSCRMWARSALYQSSGAYGFRDQLQDSMAFVYAEPAITRAHLLRAASRQFLEGDVQHWWHEPSGRGVRTRFSDDLAWLPFVADHYVRVTGDSDVLNAPAPYLTMRPLGAGEQEAYDLPVVTDVTGSLYEHCVRAIEHACTVGDHGLPLMGAGDWNDGMNRVGAHGKGESVWLAWFLAATLRAFAVHAEARGDVSAAARWRARAADYAAAAERAGWDGAWYRRAFYDDGTPLGTAAADECRIDAIAQSWAVLSGAADPERARIAMRSVNEQLIRDDAELLLLLAPPFDRSTHDPGYIKGYLPGIRENGAQYTHAAVWTVLAMARLGDGGRAAELMRMLNPLSRTRTRDDARRYVTEPYVIAGDVYAAPGHEGRGGWSWYTGAASWSYRAALEGILGFEKRGDRLRLDPCIPTAWPGFVLEYRYGNTVYEITVSNPQTVSRGVASITVDRLAATDEWIHLIDDGTRHVVTVVLGAPHPSPSSRR
ncbi:MAG TPA: glucoamylase family protein [Gemmatimonadaceae bacterium]|nr:glucoamylase family protein [Gemmatimonadaceae bacterium]